MEQDVTYAHTHTIIQPYIDPNIGRWIVGYVRKAYGGRALASLIIYFHNLFNPACYYSYKTYTHTHPYKANLYVFELDLDSRNEYEVLN